MATALHGMRSLALVALVLLSISSAEALEISFLGRLFDFGRLTRFDIYARNMRGLYIEHSDFGNFGYVETFHIPHNRYAYSVYYADECIARNLDRISTVYYYKWADKTMCRIVSLNNKSVYVIKSEEGWFRADFIEFREADAEFAPGGIVNIDGPCVDVPGMKCQRYIERKIFTPVEFFNIKSVVDDAGHELFNLNDCKLKRVVTVAVGKNINDICCVMEVEDENEEEQLVYKIMKGGEMVEMTPEQIENWNMTTTVAKVRDAVQRTRAVLGLVLIPIYRVCMYPLSILWRFAVGPPPPPLRSAFLVPYDIKARTSDRAVVWSVGLAKGHTKYTIYPSKGYLFNPIMYGKRCIWTRESEYVYRVEVLYHALYKLVRLDVFVSHRHTYCKFYHFNDEDALSFIDHAAYFYSYVSLHRDCKLVAHIDAMLEYELDPYGRHDMYHNIIDDERRIVQVSGYNRSLWTIKSDGTLVVATSMLAGKGVDDLTYFWITLRDSNGSFKYMSFVYDDVAEELYPCELVPGNVLEAREIMARSTAKCDTEYSLMLKLERCVQVRYPVMVPAFNRVPTDEEGEVIVVEEAPFKHVFTNECMGSAGLKPSAWHTSAVYHNLFGIAHILHYIYTEDGRSTESFFQYCYIKYYDTSFKAYRVFKQDYQIPVVYDVRENNSAIVWEPGETSKILYGTCVPGHFIQSVVNGNDKIWSFKSDFPEVFHHIEAIQLLLWVRFDVYIINNVGRVFRDMDAPWHNEAYMNYYHGGWLDAP